MRSDFLFTSESVSEGHPDKVSDQISDAIVDLFLTKDPEARVACETLTTTQTVILAGEIRGEGIMDTDGNWAPGVQDEIEAAVRAAVRDIGYAVRLPWRRCLRTTSPSSAHIAQGWMPAQQGQGPAPGISSATPRRTLDLCLRRWTTVTRFSGAWRRPQSGVSPSRARLQGQVTLRYENEHRGGGDGARLSTQHAGYYYHHDAATMRNMPTPLLVKGVSPVLL